MEKLLFILLGLLVIMVGCSEETSPEENKNEKQNLVEATVEKDSAEQTEVEDASDDVVEETKKETEQIDQEVGKLDEVMDITVAKEIITDYSLSEGDKLIDVDLKDNEITAVIELATNDLFSSADMATLSYSRASDELLNHNGWEVLSIEYSGIGTISMNRNETKTNEWGMNYFPTEIIIEKLK